MDLNRLLDLSIECEQRRTQRLRVVSKKSQDEFVIAGYASVDVIDRTNEEIPLGVLRDMINRFMHAGEGGYKVVAFEHETPYPVGRVIEYYGSYKTEVDSVGLFIVAEIRGDTETGKLMRQKIANNEFASFSVHIEVLDSEEVCEQKQCYTRITKANLLEISVVKEPANQASHFKVVKKQLEA